MIVRDAKVSDATRINALVSLHAEVDRMLFRSLADIYDNLQTFVVAEEGGKVVGCGAIQVVWSDLAEIKSLAVDADCFGRGIGSAIVERLVQKARGMGVQRVFALTLETGFFEKVGFKRIDTELLPMKVWSDCSRCPKQDHCDETAYILNLLPL
ncbi:MAG TPA: N-acetyltransferase [Sedimentisphaerales bacterium]|nr:N-acetyltransferase [Sedimentisphaerales bacterium]